MFYFCHVLSEDVETQQRGVICILWGGPDKNNIQRFSGAPGIRVAVPSGKGCEDATQIRMVAIHMCLPMTPFYRLVKSFYVFVAAERYLQRMVFHHGKSYTYPTFAQRLSCEHRWIHAQMYKRTNTSGSCPIM
jgi:hypothetical protein